MTSMGANRALAHDRVNAQVEVEKGVICSSLSLTPSLSLTLASDHPTAIPHDTVSYSVTVTNTGSAFGLTGTLFVRNLEEQQATIAAYSDQLEYYSEHGDRWIPFAGASAATPGYTPVVTPPSIGGLTLKPASSFRSDDVHYPATGDAILGTQIGSHTHGGWTWTASATLAPSLIALLSDAIRSGRLRNVIHVEVTPRNPKSGQPFDDRVVFPNPLQSRQIKDDDRDDENNSQQHVLCRSRSSNNDDGEPEDHNPDDQVHASPTPGQTGNAARLTIVITPPDSSPVTFTPATAPQLAALAPGASAKVTTPFTVPVVLAKGTSESDAQYVARLGTINGATLAAAATATGSAPNGSPISAAPASSTTAEHLPIVSIAKTGPAHADAGTTATYPIALANGGGAPAGPLSITDGLPDGSSGTVTNVPASIAPGASAPAPAQASYAIPISQPTGPLADTATMTWKDVNGNSYGPVSSTFTTQVTSSYAGSKLTLSPTSAGPNVVGTSQTLQATFLDRNGSPLAGRTISFDVAGPNATTGTVMTDASGVASFTYTGTHDGTDVVQATFSEGAFTVQSNTASVGWITPIRPVSTTTVHGNFFPADPSAQSFVAKPGDTPAFGQDFPNVNFNPPTSGLPSRQPFVGPQTRPFTDVTTNVAGATTGTIPAQGNGQQAGVGTMNGFDAVFTSSLVASKAEDVTLTIHHDDGFILGVSGGATSGGGPQINPPAATPFSNYPVMGSVNAPTPGTDAVTVHFPAAGSYPYELDYFEAGGGNLSLTMGSARAAATVPVRQYLSAA